MFILKSASELSQIDCVTMGISFRNHILNSTRLLSQIDCGHYGNFFSKSHLEFFAIVVSDGLRSLQDLLKSRHSLLALG